MVPTYRRRPVDKRLSASPCWEKSFFFLIPETPGITGFPESFRPAETRVGGILTRQLKGNNSCQANVLMRPPTMIPQRNIIDPAVTLSAAPRGNDG